MEGPSFTAEYPSNYDEKTQVVAYNYATDYWESAKYYVQLCKNACYCIVISNRHYYIYHLNNCLISAITALGRLKTAFTGRVKYNRDDSFGCLE